jgi:hypothetical protein
MGIESAELLAPTAEGLRNIVRMAYAAGRARGREEANRVLRGLAESPSLSAPPFNGAGRSLGEAHAPETRISEAVRHWIAAAVSPYERNLA